MTDYFRARGIACCAVISGAVEADQQALVADRETAISDLKSGKLAVLFSVDMFNEGLDIPELDMVMFLRPTQSPIVFLHSWAGACAKAGAKAMSMSWILSATIKKPICCPFC